MKKKDIDKFEKLNSQLVGTYNEINLLSKKAPNDGVNEFKLKFINQVLKEANEILGKKYRPFSEFNNFNKENLPTNSDVTFILVQYLNCMEKLRVDNITTYDDNSWVWLVNGEESTIWTSSPKKIKGN